MGGWTKEERDGEGKREEGVRRIKGKKKRKGRRKEALQVLERTGGPRRYHLTDECGMPTIAMTALTSLSSGGFTSPLYPDSALSKGTPW